MCVHSLLSELPFKHFEEERQDGGQERSKLGIQRSTQCFNEGDYGKLEGSILPKIGHEPEYLGSVVSDVLFNDSNQDGELLQVELLQPSGGGTCNSSKCWDNLTEMLASYNACSGMITCGKKVTHFKP